MRLAARWALGLAALLVSLLLLALALLPLLVASLAVAWLVAQRLGWSAEMLDKLDRVKSRGIEAVRIAREVASALRLANIWQHAVRRMMGDMRIGAPARAGIRRGALAVGACAAVSLNLRRTMSAGPSRRISCSR